MALCKYPQVVHKWDHAEFDKVYQPGAQAAWSGICRCQGCEREVVHTFGNPLPPQDHHQHTAGQGRISWRLAVTDSPAP